MGDKLLLRLNIYGKPIANKYCEGKMKRTLKKELKDLKSLRSKDLQQCSGCALTVQRGLEVFSSSLKAQGISKNSILPYLRVHKTRVRSVCCGNQLVGRTRFRPKSLPAKSQPGLRPLIRTLSKKLQVTRLETRTKESNTYASRRV